MTAKNMNVDLLENYINFQETEFVEVNDQYANSLRLAANGFYSRQQQEKCKECTTNSDKYDSLGRKKFNIDPKKGNYLEFSSIG